MPFNAKHIIKSAAKPATLKTKSKTKTVKPPEPVKLKRGKRVEFPPPVVPKHFCVDCIYYDFANRIPNGNSVCNHDKMLGQVAALMRVDEKKCGLDGKYFKHVGPKDSEFRKMSIAAQKKADAAAAKAAKKDNPKFGKKKKYKQDSEDKPDHKPKRKLKGFKRLR